MPAKKEKRYLKKDAISILVYIIVGILLYYIIGILLKISYLFLGLPPFCPFRNNVFINNPLALLLNFIHAILYSTPILIIMHTLFMIVLVIVFIIWVIWIILNKIPIFGPAILGSVPPFREFEEAGIFRLIENISKYISVVIPKSILQGLVLIYIELLSFSKERITDFILLANPDAELNDKTFDDIISTIKSASGVETFENKKPDNMFFKKSKEAIEEKNVADNYKSIISVKPNMDITDRLMISFENEMNRVQVKLDNIPNNVKNDVAAAMYNLD